MIFSIHTLELSLIFKTKKQYDELLATVRKRSKKNDQTYFDKGTVYKDDALVKHGIKIKYDGDTRKKITLIVNPSKLLGGDDLVLWNPDKANIAKLLEKLDMYIDDYFDSEYDLDDFTLTRIDFVVNIQMGSKEYVSAYIDVLHRLGKVKGFSQKHDNDDETMNLYNKKLSFDLQGNSNDIDFSAYADKEILRIEAKLMKPKSIKKCTNETDTSKQIKDLSKHSREIFLEIFTQIVPFGDFLTKNDAVKIVGDNVTKNTQRAKMLRLIDLIPKKKSLLLAQKEMADRNISKVMERFAKLNLSPVTIGKRSKIKYLKNLYNYLFERT